MQIRDYLRSSLSSATLITHPVPHVHAPHVGKLLHKELLFDRDQLTGNPYESPSSTLGGSSTDSVATPFPFIAGGPVVGASVGVSHVAAMAGVWAFHGYPNSFFRTPDWVWIGAIVMAIGGALFGLLYAVILRFTMNSMSLTLRNRRRFYGAIAASIVVTIITCELSLQRSILLNPLLVLAVIVACAFGAALATGKSMQAQP